MATSKGDIYRRKQSIIDTALLNDLVATLFQKHHKQLLYLITDHTEEIFTDTYLILTRVYKPDQDFVSEFKRLFRNLKLEYSEKTRLLNYTLATFEDAYNDSEERDNI